MVIWGHIVSRIQHSDSDQQLQGGHLYHHRHSNHHHASKAATRQIGTVDSSVAEAKAPSHQGSTTTPVSH